MNSRTGARAFYDLGPGDLARTGLAQDQHVEGLALPFPGDARRSQRGGEQQHHRELQGHNEEGHVGHVRGVDETPGRMGRGD